MNELVVGQMHGEPGSGKSTLARAIGRVLGAVVIDKDILATGPIRAGVPFDDAGKVAYETLWLLLPSFLNQGLSVIVDSPCYWPNIEEQGRAAAAQAAAGYAMIECRCDGELIERRLATRHRLESNPRKRGAGFGRPGMYEPSCERLVLDAARPLDELAADALAYLCQPNPQLTIPNRQSPIGNRQSPS